jgi:GT2 family glycosyltransferase
MQVAFRREKLAILIVSYGNPGDVVRCLESLASSGWREFEVFICENAGRKGYDDLLSEVTAEGGPLLRLDCVEDIDRPGERLVRVANCRFVERPNVVRLGEAVENLGYGGGVNAWLERIVAHSGWEAALILNPDTQVSASCLTELMTKMNEGFGMVGGTLVFDNAPHTVINYGLAWSTLTGRITAVGRNALAGTAPSTETLAAIDAISGACVLVSREFVKENGPMAEDYFLYMEDLDWGRRRGRQRIGFAPRAVIRHVCGTSIGSAVDPSQRSPLSTYLSARNSILYARRWAGRLWLLHAVFGFFYAAKYLLHGAPAAAKIALAGLIDGMRGKTGRPALKRIEKT